MAEWLGTGLQNRLRRFESAWNLNRSSDRPVIKAFGAFPLSMEALLYQIAQFA